MKLITKSLTAAAVLAMGHSAMAANFTVYLTGSTAFRAAVQGVLTVPAASGGVLDTVTGIDTLSGAPAPGATFINVTGTVGADTYTIKCAFTGSAGGIFLVGNNQAGAANAPTQNFLVTGGGNGTAVQGDIHTCDLTLSDAYQGSCKLALRPSQNTKHLVTSGLSGDDQLAIVTFKWVGNYSMANPPAGATAVKNITSQMIQTLYTGTPQTSASLFAGTDAAPSGGTATSTDGQIFVLPIGRDFDSGTRISAFADSGAGINAVPNQWQPFLESNTGTLGAFVGTPAGGPNAAHKYITNVQNWNGGTDYTIFGILNVDAGNGNGGFNSGGQIAQVLRCDSTGSTTTGDSLAGSFGVPGVYFVSYLGSSDAVTTLSPTAALTIPAPAGNFATTGGTILTVGSTAGIVQGVGITDTTVTTAIPANTLVVGVIDGTHLLISQPVASTIPNTHVVQIKAASFAGAGPGVELTYNGVKFSPLAIQQGQYSFWGYEHLLFNAAQSGTGAGGFINTVFTKLDSAIKNFSDPLLTGAGLKAASMQVSRGSDGGAISINYTP